MAHSRPRGFSQENFELPFWALRGIYDYALTLNIQPLMGGYLMPQTSSEYFEKVLQGVRHRPLEHSSLAFPKGDAPHEVAAPHAPRAPRV